MGLAQLRDLRVPGPPRLVEALPRLVVRSELSDAARPGLSHGQQQQGGPVQLVGADAEARGPVQPQAPGQPCRGGVERHGRSRCDALHGGRIAGADRLVIARNPLRTGLGEADVTLALGECDENASGPGVSCVAAIKRNPNAAPIDRVIGFAKSASGEWVATNY